MRTVRWGSVAAYWIVIVLAFAAALYGLLSPLQLILPLVAVFLCARYAPRRHVWLTVVPVVPFVALWVINGGPWWDALLVVGSYTGCLSLGVLLAERRAHRAAKEQLARAAERTSIAREMHDIVAHNLAVIVALADGAVASAATSPAQATDLMTKVATTGRQALSEVRELIGLLRDDARTADLDRLVDHVRAAGLAVTLTRTGAPARLGPSIELTVYRIVQEALTNTIKHAGPMASAEIVVHYDRSAVEVEVTDDGIGKSTAQGGHGLAGMRERITAHGGTFDCGPRAGGGWRVNARLMAPS